MAAARRRAASRRRPAVEASEAEPTTEVADVPQGPAAKTEAPTRFVDPMHHGDHVTITEAIEAADPGDRIVVRPGLYQEGLVIDKPLEIIGEGAADEVVVQATGTKALVFKTTMGRVANLTLRQIGGKGSWYGVNIAQGRLELEGCDITSEGLSCVAIHSGADPRLRRNRIHDGMSAGVFVYDNGQGSLEENDIFGNAHAGVAISKGANPTLRRNRIHDGKEVGVFVFENGRETLEDNDIFGNAYDGVRILEKSNPTLRRNRINRNGYEAVRINEDGGGTFEDNDLWDNAKGAWDISKDSEGNVTRVRNQE